MKLRIKAIGLLINQSKYDKREKLKYYENFHHIFFHIFIFFNRNSRLFCSIQFYFIPGNKIGAENVA